VGGLLLGAVIPFTLVVIMPTNKCLLEPALDKSSEFAQQLLVRWGKLHAVRSVLSVVALVTSSFLPKRVPLDALRSVAHCSAA
jgi:hypothetical protein